MSDDYNGVDEIEIRTRIEKQFDMKVEFNTHLVIFAIINLLMWGGWVIFRGVEGASPFLANVPWPVLVTGGWGSGIVAHWLEVYFSTGERANRVQDTIENEMVSLHGLDWRETTNKSTQKKIRKRITKPFEERKEFFIHASIFAIINIMLFALWSRGLGTELGIEFPAPILVLIGWGIGLVAHGANVFFGNLMKNMRELAIEAELEREHERIYGKPKHKPKRDERLMLTDDGELQEIIEDESGDEYEQNYG